MLVCREELNRGGSTEQGSGAGVLARCANDEAYGRRGSSSGNGEQRSTARTRAGERARGGSEGAQVGEGEKRAQSTFIGRERERRRGEGERMAGGFKAINGGRLHH